MNYIKDLQNPDTSKAILLFKEGIPKGLLGLIANRLKNAYKVPVVVIGLENGVGYASVRAPKGFNFLKIMEQCEDLVLQFGGHPCALGFTIKKENLGAFTERLASLIYPVEDAEEVFQIDAETRISEVLEEETKTALMQFPPYGEGHSPPLFLLKDFEIERVQILKDKHTRLELKEQGFRMSAICFNRLFEKAPVQLLGYPQFNPYRGCLELKVEDAF